VARGEFALPAPAPKVARFVFGALQGALLVKRTTDDPSQLDDVIAVMKLQLAARSAV
jgi:TetR/AcrR family transcriptional repressor of nem operon